MTEPTGLFLGPEENLAILKEIFSTRKSSAEEIATKINKNKGTVLNAIHDLKILALIENNMETSDAARNIVYERGAKEALKERFLAIKGNRESVEEINSKKNYDPLEVGRTFCFHTHARAAKDSSLKQIGRLYLRWLRFLELVNVQEEVKENGPRD